MVRPSPKHYQRALQRDARCGETVTANKTSDPTSSHRLRIARQKLEGRPARPKSSSTPRGAPTGSSSGVSKLRIGFLGTRGEQIMPRRSVCAARVFWMSKNQDLRYRVRAQDAFLLTYRTHHICASVNIIESIIARVVSVMFQDTNYAYPGALCNPARLSALRESESLRA